MGIKFSYIVASVGLLKLIIDLDGKNISYQ